MKSIAAAAFSLSLITNAAFAEPVMTLAPGKPAGVKEATLDSPLPWIFLGVAAVVGIAVAVSAGGNNNGVPGSSGNTGGGGTTTTTTTTT